MSLRKFVLEKKHKYFIQSATFTIFLYLVSFKVLHLQFWQLVAVVGIIAFLGTLVTQYPNIDFNNFFYSVVLPVSLSVGALLFLSYFPNLGIPFKVFTIFCFGAFHYLICLVDNIFLVVHDREEVIPLYRVATAWSQIVQAIVAIPLFSGIYKFNTNGLYQSLIIALVVFIFVLYQVWVSRYDTDAKKMGVGETIILTLISVFVVFSLSLSLSFIATEAFLKGILMSLVLLFMLTYVFSHLRNQINKKILSQQVVIFIIFLLLLLLFTP